jgi:glycosyltransferase involved in cell wall biosynthesis
MCTLNGARYLEQQLDSVEAQHLTIWRLIVSDDGSVDGTLDMLRERQKKWGAERLEIRAGLRKGFASNFLSLASDPTIVGDYFAFCDQDDYWFPNKLSRAIEVLTTQANNEEANLYCGRTVYTDSSLNNIGLSPLFVHPATFRNALVQSIGGGNTMVFNTRVKHLIENTYPVTIVSHDWWLYQIVTGASGRVLYDPEPTISYRQHSNNLVGENKGFLSRLRRLSWVIRGRYRSWNDVNVAALLKNKQFLARENVQILELFVLLRSARLKDRLRLIEVCGLYRQTWQGTVSLIFAAIFKKI